MNWKPLNILTLNTETEEWTKTHFETFQEYRLFILSMWKFPGEYNFKNTHYWNALALKYERDKRYTDYPENSKEYKEFWILERRKCEQGIIVDGRYISGDLYFFWNFLKIPNKIEAKETFAEIWDSLYHYDLHIYLAWLYGQDVAGTKSRQKGAEQPNSELIMTKEGWRPMGSIKVGDLIYTPKGTLTKVLEIFPQGVKDVYELELLDGRKVKCGENHLWAVKRKKGGGKHKDKINILSTKELLEKGLTYKTTAPAFGGKKEYLGFIYSLPGIEPTQFEKKELKIPPYVLGCLLGDGSTNKKSVQLCSADQQIFDEVIKELGDDYYYGSKDKQENNQSWRYNICYKGRFDFENNQEYINYKQGVNPLKRYIDAYGLGESNCYNKHIPKDYLFSNFEDRLALLQGLMDTDGYVNKEGADYHFTTVSEQLALDVAHLSRSLGINTIVAKFNKAKEENADYYRVRLKPKFPLFRLKRKLERQENRTSKSYRADNSIKSITKLDYQEESTCIMVEDEDHLYLTRDFIPTHNSLYHMSRLTKRLWFGNKLNLKVLSNDDQYILDEWAIMQGYRNFINNETGWYRTFNPDGSLEWEQKQEVTLGTINKKKVYKGNMSKIRGLTTKMNITKGVGGSSFEIYVTEAGINPKLKKIKEYVDPNIKMGNVKTGIFLAMGSVGELKDAEPLMDMVLNPKAYNIRPVKNTFADKEDEEVGFFWPEEWNFTYEDEETGQIIKCYDKDGNSNIELAVSLIEKEIERQRKLKDPTSFRLWLSQHPRTLQDAFDQREDNPFPTHLLKPRELELIPVKDIVVKLERNPQGKVVHKFCNDTPINTLKVNPEADNRGAVVIWEFPMADPPLGLYYAGVDPIKNLDTSTSKSLFSITIRIAMHEREGKIVEDYPVATYIGRHKRASDTFQVALDLIEFYNAQTAVENNVTDFIEWMIRQGKSKYLMRRKQLKVIAELSPNSSIGDEIGVRMEGEFKKRCLEKFITELEEPISESFDLATGESKTIYGVSKYKDLWLIRECLKYTPKLNTDRCFLKDTFILTPSGYKEIQNISLKDDVISHNGTVNKVIELHKNEYKGDLYKIRITGQHKHLSCTEEHPILIGRRSRNLSGPCWNEIKKQIDIVDYVPAKEVKKGDLIFIPKNTNLISTGFTNEELYLMGWYLGDGYISNKSPNHLQYCLGTHEEDKAIQICELLNNLSNAPSTKGKRTYASLPARYKFDKQGKKCIHLFFTHKELCQSMRENCGGPNNKFISKKIFNAPMEEGLSFIAGLFASDGHFINGSNYDGCSRYNLSFSTKYEKVCYQVKQMLLNYGIWSTMRKVKNGKSYAYILEVQGYNNINKITSVFNIYPQIEPVKRRLQELYVETDEGFWVNVKSIEKEYIENTVYNFGVESTNTYVADNVSVHNCISNMLAKIACDSSANRHIIKSLNHAPKPKQEVPRNLPSAFKSSLPSSFGRKLKGHF